MRKDMQKVLTERERYGSSAPNRKVGKKVRAHDVTEDYDEQPKRLSRKHVYGGRRKGFTDVLGPLRRFLRSNVGRPWNKVYGEIREHMDDRSLTGLHLFQHLSWEVELEVEEREDGKVYPVRRNYYGGPVRGFYVHPRTGLLRWAPERRYQGPEPKDERPRVRISDTEAYVKVAGIWYRAVYEVLDAPPQSVAAHGAPEWLWYREGRRWLHCIGKKQCGARELRAAGLENSHDGD